MLTPRRLPSFFLIRISAWLTGMALGASLAVAAPAEGTAGQTVTARSVQGPATGARRAASAKPVPPSRPTWQELSAEQRQALDPLASLWNSLSEERKRKWLAISRQFPSLSAEEQAKLHRRMARWAILTKEERAQARQNFTTIKSLAPDRKSAEWEAYQALSPEEKRKLAAQAPARTGGFATVKPASQPKLSQLPKRASPPDARMAEAALPVPAALPWQSQDTIRSEPERSPYEDEPASSR